jgi:SPP1 family predicted phage head-tail adaptor
MRAGRLDRRITIQSKTEVIDVYGQRTLTWATFLTVWSDPIEKLGGEQTQDNNRSTKRMVDFRVRWNSTITNEMRILWESEFYKIEDIKEISRQEGLIIRTSKLAQT